MSVIRGNGPIFKVILRISAGANVWNLKKWSYIQSHIREKCRSKCPESVEVVLYSRTY